MDKKHAENIIAAIGRALFHDADQLGEDWDAVTLIAVVDEGFVDLTLFRYEDGEDGPMEATANYSELVRSFRLATQDEGTRPWAALYYGIVAETGDYRVRVEYDDPDRWRVTPDNFDTMPKALNPLLGEPP